MRWRLLSIRMVILILSPPNYQGSCGSFFCEMVSFSRIDTVRLPLELVRCGAIVAVKKLGCELRSALPILDIMNVRSSKGHLARSTAS